MSVKKKKKIYVKITRCSHKNYWYFHKKYMGRIYEVVPKENFDDWWLAIRCFTTGAKSNICGIRKLDAKIVSYNRIPSKTRMIRCL